MKNLFKSSLIFSIIFSVLLSPCLAQEDAKSAIYFYYLAPPYTESELQKLEKQELVDPIFSISNNKDGIPVSYVRNNLAGPISFPTAPKITFDFANADGSPITKGKTDQPPAPPAFAVSLDPKSQFHLLLLSKDSQGKYQTKVTPLPSDKFPEGSVTILNQSSAPIASLVHDKKILVQSGEIKSVQLPLKDRERFDFNIIAQVDGATKNLLEGKSRFREGMRYIALILPSNQPGVKVPVVQMIADNIRHYEKALNQPSPKKSSTN